MLPQANASDEVILGISELLRLQGLRPPDDSANVMSTEKAPITRRVREAGTATGDAKMIYFSPDMKPISSVTSYYVPTPFVTMRNTYSGGVTMQAAPHEDEPDELLVESRSPEEVHIAKQTARVVEDALARLPPAQREAFVLIRYEGMSVADAARILAVVLHRVTRA